MLFPVTTVTPPTLPAPRGCGAPLWPQSHSLPGASSTLRWGCSLQRPTQLYHSPARYLCGSPPFRTDAWAHMQGPLLPQFCLLPDSELTKQCIPQPWGDDSPLGARFLPAIFFTFPPCLPMSYSSCISTTSSMIPQKLSVPSCSLNTSCFPQWEMYPKESQCFFPKLLRVDTVPHISSLQSLH
jgi:hypothetical protein